jgi:hypothetical protein
MSSFRCPACSKSYTVRNGRPDGRYLCPQCKRPLVPTAELPKTGTAMAAAKTPPKPAAPAIAGRPGHRERKRKSGGAWVFWVAAALLAAVGGWAFYRYAPSGTPGAIGTKKEAEARKDFSSQGVMLSIEEPAGIDRKAEPVTSGVPLPQGCVSDPGQLLLADEKGQPVPCQFTPQCRWPDGSVKWVLLDFQADVPAKGKTSYRLETGRSSPPASKPVMVSEAGSIMKMVTGDVGLTINRNATCLVESVTLNGKTMVAAEKPIQVEMMTGDGKRYWASKPSKVIVESSGPLLATVLVSGHFVATDGARIFDGKVGYDLRVTVYAGRPVVNLRFTLRNDGFYGYRNEGKPRQWLYLQHLRLDVPLAEVPEGAGWTAAGLPVELGRRPARLVQWIKYPQRDCCGLVANVFEEESERERLDGASKLEKGFYYDLDTGYDRSGRPRKLAGWAELSSGPGAVLAAR